MKMTECLDVILLIISETDLMRSFFTNEQYYF